MLRQVDFFKCKLMSSYQALSGFPPHADDPEGVDLDLLLLLLAVLAALGPVPVLGEGGEPALELVLVEEVLLDRADAVDVLHALVVVLDLRGDLVVDLEHGLKRGT